jgi:drug/metabolite transporter (DMT)-like permease
MSSIRDPRLAACAGLALGQLFWAGNNIVARAMVGEIPPIAMQFWRWVIALLILVPLSRNYLRRDWPVLRGSLPRIFVLAITSITTYNTLLYIAAQTTTAINLTLVGQTLPVVTVALAWPMLRHVPTAREIGAMVLGFAGLVVIMTHASLETLLALTLNEGDSLMLLATVSWAVYSILLKRYALAVHPLSLLTVMVILSVPLISPFYLIEVSDVGGFTLDATSVSVFLYLGVFPSIFSMLLWNYGVAATGPYTAAMFGYFHPLFTVLLALPLLGERLYGFHFAGGALVLTGVYLAVRSGERPRASVAAPDAPL